MGFTQDGVDVRLAFKEQDDYDTPASGAGAFAIDVRPSQGLSKQFAQIESAMQHQSRMGETPEPGSITASAAYETELHTGAGDKVVRTVLGSEAKAKTVLTQVALTSATITGAGVTLTFGGGNLHDYGVVAGSMLSLAGMATAANNIPFPVESIDATGRIVTVRPGYLTDEAIDSAFSLTIHKQYSTPNPYIKRYLTVEEYFSAMDARKRGESMVMNALNIGAGANAISTFGFGLSGRDMDIDDASIFDDPTYGLEDDLQMKLIDGALFADDVKEVNFTQFSLSLVAPVNTTPVGGTRRSPNVSLGVFKLSGNFARVLTDILIAQKVAEVQKISMHALFCAPGDPTKFVSVYAGSLRGTAHQSPIGGDNAVLETIPLVGGRDPRGQGYAETSILWSTSAADDDDVES